MRNGTCEPRTTFKLADWWTKEESITILVVETMSHISNTMNHERQWWRPTPSHIQRPQNSPLDHSKSKVDEAVYQKSDKKTAKQDP